MLNNAITAVVVGAVAVLGFVFGMSTNQPAVNVGAVPGTDHYSHEWFAKGITVGGGVLATSSIGAATYTAAQLTSNRLIVHTAASALTVTLPASSTLANFVPNAGDTRVLYISPVTTLITLAGGTGTELNTASSTKNINAGGLGRLEFVRKANKDIEVLLTPGI